MLGTPDVCKKIHNARSSRKQETENDTLTTTTIYKMSGQFLPEELTPVLAGYTVE
jgi:hypothetical protein